MKSEEMSDDVVYFDLKVETFMDLKFREKTTFLKYKGHTEFKKRDINGIATLSDGFFELWYEKIWDDINLLPPNNNYVFRINRRELFSCRLSNSQSKTLAFALLFSTFNDIYDHSSVRGRRIKGYHERLQKLMNRYEGVQS